MPSYAKDRCWAIVGLLTTGVLGCAADTGADDAETGHVVEAVVGVDTYLYLM